METDAELYTWNLRRRQTDGLVIMNIKKKQTKQNKTAKPDTKKKIFGRSDKNKKTDLREDPKDSRKVKSAGKSSGIFDPEPVP